MEKLNREERGKIASVLIQSIRRMFITGPALRFWNGFRKVFRTCAKNN